MSVGVRDCAAQRRYDIRPEVKRQAFVAARVIVSAQEFVTGVPDQHSARHQLELAAPAVAAEAPLAHVGHRKIAVLLGERRRFRAGAAPEIDDRDEVALQEMGRLHGAAIVVQPGRATRQFALTQR